MQYWLRCASVDVRGGKTAAGDAFTREKVCVMDNVWSVLIAIGLVVALVGVILLLGIAEPPQHAVIATERLDVAVLGFANSSAWRGAAGTLQARIETELVNTPGITVFSRSRLDQLLTEQMLGEVGICDPATAARIGSLTGVNKLITGTVYAIDTSKEPTTVCEEWKNGECVSLVPANRYRLQLLAQIQIVDTRSGQIEQACDCEGEDTVTIKEGSSFGGYEGLLVAAATDIASDVSSLLISSYTRELHYGLYRSVTRKREGYVGEDETSRFSRSDLNALLIVHFNRVRSGDLFELYWIDSSGKTVESARDTVTNGQWCLYTLSLTDLQIGRFTVQGYLDGIKAFERAFVINP